MTCFGCPKAIAHIQGGSDYPEICGTVKFFECARGVLVEAEISGLPQTEANFFAFHIHQGDNCKGEGFSGSGGHYNPDKTDHPEHSGDLPPLLSSKGRAYMAVRTDRFRWQEIIGRTVIIHKAPDDFHTQPSGNAGEKIACGIIRRI